MYPHNKLSKATMTFRGFIVGIALILVASTVQATSVIPPEFPELVNESDYIVRAVVKSVTSEVRVTPSGRRMIFTLVALEVTQVVAGKPPSPLILQMAGGKHGDWEQTVSDMPKLAVGLESFFFVQGNGRQICPLVRMGHGLYPITREAGVHKEAVLRMNGKALEGVNEISQPIHPINEASGQISATALSPDDFVLKIREAVTKSTLREH
jgi:hypothetical protein